MQKWLWNLNSVKMIPDIQYTVTNDIQKVIEEACHELGAFYVTHDRFDSGFVDQLFVELRAFFHLSQGAKMASKADFDNYYMGFRPIGSEKSILGGDYEQCEQYKLGFVKRLNGTSYSNISERLSNDVFQNKTTRMFWENVRKFSDSLQGYFASILGFNADYFDQFMDNPLHNLGLNYYPSNPEPKDRLFPHVDFSMFSIIIQESPGLLIKPRSGDWIEAPVMKGKLLVIIGEYLKRWSNGYLWAPPHRVKGNSSKERYAVVYKQRPSFNTVISIPGKPDVHVGNLYEKKLQSIVGNFPQATEHKTANLG
ncbi:2OG-Fe(II) oxygenase family protein [Moorena sp. SIOASIH]|uniref:2OG-Fe(II) oxygenase family protein n=1 Tax=Moorena sp. SIOASIH TaxID=2607817 RepID=UPI0025E3F67A|nr:2OG-Fe(II) oxygenase family protein [Moorena sp. SIOASIH]